LFPIPDLYFLHSVNLIAYYSQESKIINASNFVISGFEFPLNSIINSCLNNFYYSDFYLNIFFMNFKAFFIWLSIFKSLAYI